MNSVSRKEAKEQRRKGKSFNCVA